MAKIKLAICGYGNLGQSAERGISQFPDLELVAILSRRGRELKTATAVPVYSLDQAASLQGQVDVCLLCSGSARDLPEQGPWLAGYFHTVDAYDTHARMPEYFSSMDNAAKKAGKTAIIAAGWDPGLLSLQRLLAQAILPLGKSETFWGKGISQGHSDAIRRLEGVLDARQYTIPKKPAVEAVLAGRMPQLSAADKHRRDCYVVAQPGTDKAKIAENIKSMPHYFADYETDVTFVSQEELDRDHKGLPHRGQLIHAGRTGDDCRQTIQFQLDLGSNPDFTAQVMLACARAAWRFYQTGQAGARTIFDIPPAWLTGESGEDLIARML